VNRQVRPDQPEKILVRVDPDLADLIPGFLKNRQKDIQSLTEAVKHEHFEIIRMVGHKMRGDGGGYGFQDITEIGAALEKAANDKNVTEIHQWLTKLSLYLERIEVVYG
jgi:hypothetical protein